MRLAQGKRTGQCKRRGRGAKAGPRDPQNFIKLFLVVSSASLPGPHDEALLSTVVAFGN
jgi:hypothetical protein